MTDIDVALRQLSHGKQLIGEANKTLRQIASGLARCGDHEGLRDLAQRLPNDTPELDVSQHAKVEYVSLRTQLDELANSIAHGELPPDMLQHIDLTR